MYVEKSHVNLTNNLGQSFSNVKCPNTYYHGRNSSYLRKKEEIKGNISARQILVTQIYRFLMLSAFS